MKAVIELASFLPFSQIHQTFLDQLTESIGVVLNMIQANMRTEELLEQSQKLTQELQSQSKELQQQQDELKRSNIGARSSRRARCASPRSCSRSSRKSCSRSTRSSRRRPVLLAEQNAKVEQKNREVESARVGARGEGASSSSLSSKYKSEFLANMSHELRTPLNSLLILAKLLAGEQGQEPHAEAGGVRADDPLVGHRPAQPDQRHSRPVEGRSGQDGGRRRPTCRCTEVARLRRAHVQAGRRAEGARASRSTSQPDVPSPIYTDGQRLQQVLKNLLSNAFKFTEQGGVTLTIRRAEKGRRFASRVARPAPRR